ncbi:hypothetical protein A0J48_014310 [Sphaerospermopsis aphanizomenoides BCCUSP55]|uniref:hypothetical protein n=1 Tax=Sphaerospermopsis aphanizomenoides TaxID=459663 RepID=UPI001903146D|nr:hypothetical protein [Sphaerospermopsis aphanizomenoides]MBK1988697.1 hypothetical protein [Sphaerospermopsis aphanizomenoides BCCUSP55]
MMSLKSQPNLLRDRTKRTGHTKKPLLSILLGLTLPTVILSTPANANQIDQIVEFDPVEAKTMLEPGKSTLKGRTFVTHNSRDRGKERIYGNQQVVYLFPMTTFARDVLAKAGNRTLVIMMLSKAQEHTARVITDKSGNFIFRGLKSGQYLLLTSIPYEADVKVRENTGRTRTRTQYNTDWFGNVISSTGVTEPIYKYREETSNLEHRIFKLVEVKDSNVVTDLGEIQ